MRDIAAGEEVTFNYGPQDADDLDEWELEELQRIKDLQERDEFAARLRKRDDAKTKKLVGEKGEEEDANGIPLNISEEEWGVFMEIFYRPCGWCHTHALRAVRGDGANVPGATRVFGPPHRRTV